MAFVINNDGLTGASGKYTALQTQFAASKAKFDKGVAALEASWGDSAGAAFQEVKAKMVAELAKEEANTGSNASLLSDVSSVASATQAKVRTEISKMMS